MSNILIVESKNDKIFLETLIQELNYSIQVSNPILIDDYEKLNGLNEGLLIQVLRKLQFNLPKGDIQKIGIVIDLDQFTISERISFVNKCVQNVFINAPNCSQPGEFIEIVSPDGSSFKLACYFTNVDGQGELETVLKAIKSQDSSYADCLASWQDCLANQGQAISPKELDKFWVSLYLRYDTCSKEEQKQAGNKCSMARFDYIMANKKHIWNFSHAILDDIKGFLHLFSEN